MSTWKRSSKAWRSSNAPSNASRSAPMASMKTWSSIQAEATAQLGLTRLDQGDRVLPRRHERDGGARALVVQGDDAPAGLHRVLDPPDALTEEARGGVEVGDVEGEAEEPGRSIARCFSRPDELEDHRTAQ